MQTQGARRRRRWSEADRKSLIERWQTSGLSAREFGEREGVRPDNLFRWRREASSSGAAARPTVTFAPVTVTPRDEALQPPAPTAGLALEVELPTGVRVRVYRGADIRAANELLSALFGRRAC